MKKILFISFFLVILVQILFPQTQDYKKSKLWEWSTLKEKGYFFPKIEKDSIVDNGPISYLDTIFIHTEMENDTIINEKIIFYKRLNQYLLSLIKTKNNHGYPFASIKKIQYQSSGIKNDTLYINLHVFIEKGNKVTLSDIIFDGLQHTHKNFLLREIKFHKNEIFDSEKIKSYISKLKKIDYLTVRDSIALIKKQNQYFLYIPIKEKNLINFDFILGYAPKIENKNSQLSGKILLNFKNLFGSGRKLFIEWEKPGSQSEKLNISYRESYVFGLPVHVILSYQNEFRDSLFSSNQKRIEIQFPGDNHKFSMSYESNRSTLDSSLFIQNQIGNINSEYILLQYQFSNFDIPQNPRRGIYLSLQSGFGTVESRDTSSSSKKNTVKFLGILEGIYPVFSIYPFLRLQYNKINMNTTIPVSEQFFIGGSKNLRGYREDAFLTNEYFLINSEIRFIIDKMARFHFFKDWAWMSNQQGHRIYKTGYGIGFLIPSKIGLLQIDYGLKKGFNFRDGVLHIRLVSDF